MITLTNDNLSAYFSLPNKNTTRLLIGKQPYDFISRNSNTLVITIGDSWTWGSDLTEVASGNLHIDRNTDDYYRLTNVFGGSLSQGLSADFLNLGEAGAGNWHISRKIAELSKISDQLNYKEIIIISIFTELGRDFNSLDDVDVDYRSWLINNITNSNSYYGFLKFINQQISKKISSDILNLDKKCKIYFGTNFVDPIGYDELQNYFLDRTWLEIVCKENNIKYAPDRCYMVFPGVIEKFNSLFDFAPELDRLTWLEWVNDLSDLANIRANTCRNDSKIFNQLLHPSAPNHKHFSNYILGKL